MLAFPFPATSSCHLPCSLRFSEPVTLSGLPHCFDGIEQGFDVLRKLNRTSIKGRMVVSKYVPMYKSLAAVNLTSFEK
jgi:hypothetical protein